MHSRILFSAASAVLCLAAGVAQGHSSGLAPASTAGLDIVLTIEHTESSLPGGFPTMGAVTQSYAADGTYMYAGFGGPNHLTGTGTYTYTKTGRDNATEDAVQYSDFFTLPYHMEYTFVTPTAGRWIQQFAGGLIVFEGSFATSPSRSNLDWVPAKLAGTTFILSTVGEHGRLTISSITHKESTYRACAEGSNKVDAGTYVAKKMAARSLVEETTGADGLVVRSFTFTSRIGGYWKATRSKDGARSEGHFLLLR
jgi:hypothetical protein